MSITIILADDHGMVREGLRLLLGRHPEMKIIGEASDGQSAISLVRELSPNVIILDISMPGMSGIDVARRLRSEKSNVKIVVLSTYAERAYAYEMLRAGVSAYVIKEAAFEELVRAINLVMCGETYVSSRIMVDMIDDLSREPSRSDSGDGSELSVRETEVLQLMANGLSTKEISAQLNISIKTVETYRRKIMERLGIGTIAELTKYAIRKGLTKL